MIKTKKFFSIILTFTLLISIFSCTNNKSENTDEKYETALQNIKPHSEYVNHTNNKYKDYQEVPYGLDVTKKFDLVGICYTTWFTEILGYNDSPVEPPNITNILSGKDDWGKEGEFHFWAEPALGYYRSHDKEIIRTHMQQLSEMGADYIIIDNTNAQMYWKNSSAWNMYITIPCTAILDTIVEMRNEGLKTPYVVFWNKTDDTNKWQVVDSIYNEFISVSKWKDCFVYWEGKPFVLTTNRIPGIPNCDITTRIQWGLKTSLTIGEWSFLNIENIPSIDINGYCEQICVSAAAQETYMTNISTAHGRNHGIFMYEQWVNAFQYRPKFITISWWNEWCAQLFIGNDGSKNFTDNYTREYSRDIEPMKGGHGDQYYQWTKQYIHSYKNNGTCPRLVEEGY